MGGGGVKNRAFCRGGVDFFWNNPLSLLSPHALFFLSTSCFSFCSSSSKESLEQAILLEFITGGGSPCKLSRGCGESKGQH